MTTTRITAETLAFIRDNFLYMRPDFVLGDDDPLLTKGVIDSLGVAEIADFVEGRYGVVVETSDITEANFGSVRRIATFVASRVAGVEAC